MTIGYIHDRYGCAAWIDEKRDVYSARTGRQIAVLRGVDLFSLTGQFIGVHLEAGGGALSGNDSEAVRRFTELTH
jgi:hypothetical protein